jgi:hypothetical protein
MPYGRIDQSLYVGPYASVEAINTTTLYKPGELGSQVQIGTKAYQLILLDSGAVAATSAGAPLCGHVAFWKNRSTYTVTNDKAQAENSAGDTRNSVAGVFNSLTSGAAGTASITAGSYGVIQQRGTHVGVLTNGTAAAAGDTLVSVASGTSATAAAVRVAAGTAPTNIVLGIATAATSAVTTNYTPARIGGADLVDVP